MPCQCHHLRKLGKNCAVFQTIKCTFGCMKLSLQIVILCLKLIVKFTHYTMTANNRSMHFILNQVSTNFLFPKSKVADQKNKVYTLQLQIYVCGDDKYALFFCFKQHYWLQVNAMGWWVFKIFKTVKAIFYHELSSYSVVLLRCKITAVEMST